ncbi:MAG TPA: hypothetical protein VJ873_07855, partial [bacterium]|nr:hypothetical protein [bacterium]
ILGSFLAAIWVTAFVVGALFLKRAVPGEGTVVSANYTKGKSAGWKLLVSYYPVNSQEVEATFWDDGQYHDLGQSVTFLYDPEDFQMLRSFGMKSQYPWVPLLFLLFCFGLITFGWYRYRRGKADEELKQELKQELINKKW